MSILQPLRFIDLEAQRLRIRERLTEAIERVLEHGDFILGPEVGKFEGRLAAYCGLRHAVTCASGTTALQLPLMAIDFGKGDAAFVPSFTFAATAEVVVLAGGSPVFVDVDPSTFNMVPESLESAVAEARSLGLKPRVVIPVDMFGQPADYTAICSIAKRNDLTVIADAAQSFGGSWAGVRVGALGDVTATSFYPSKPLGCYGDGGAVLVDDGQMAEVMRSLRVHGAGGHRNKTVRIGINGRLDTIQAAILLVKLEIFPEELETRRKIVRRYEDGLRDVVELPVVHPDASSVWAQYTIQVDRRDDVVQRLRERGIPTAIYYPVPMHRQEPYVQFPKASGGLETSERLAGRVLSVPMHPYLAESAQEAVIAGVREAVTAGNGPRR